MPAIEEAFRVFVVPKSNSAGSIIVQASFTRFACQNFVLASRNTCRSRKFEFDLFEPVICFSHFRLNSFMSGDRSTHFWRVAKKCVLGYVVTSPSST
jgi:hypothetical protein